MPFYPNMFTGAYGRIRFQRPESNEPDEFDPNDNPLNGDMGALVPAADANFISASAGPNDWSSAASWLQSDGSPAASAPTANAKVFVREGHTITLDANTPDLDWVRVDGTLNFDHTQSVQLHVEYLHVSMTGSFRQGGTSSSSPLSAAFTHEVLISDRGNLDAANDLALMGRAITTMGISLVYAAPKTPYGIVSVDPQQGDTSVTMADAPFGWEIGDTIVIAGSKHTGWGWNGSANAYRGHEDEVRTITGISGNVISFSGGLTYDHDGYNPTSNRRNAADMKVHVANFTRNCKWTAENAASLQVHQRPHSMFMRMMDSINIEHRYLEIYGFGRTDKRSASVSTSAEQGPYNATTNARGRYAWHCHLMGTPLAGQKNPPVLFRSSLHGPEFNPANAPGWAGSPGWGFVQHGSPGDWYQNVTYGCLGSAYVGEDGTEHGTWKENLAIWCSGGVAADNPKNAVLGGDRDDSGNIGYGNHNAGRILRGKGNIVASAKGALEFWHRGGVDPITDELPLKRRFFRSYSDVTTNKDEVPINFWDQTVGYALTQPVVVVKEAPEQEHEYWTIFDTATFWNSVKECHFEYTGNYSVLNFFNAGVGTDAQSGSSFYRSSNQDGFHFSNSAAGFAFVDCTAENFQYGIYFNPAQAAFDRGTPNSANDRELLYVGWEFSNMFGGSGYAPGSDASNPDITEFASQAALPGSALATTSLAYTIPNLTTNVELTGTVTDSAGNRGMYQSWGNGFVRGSNITRYIEEYGYWQKGGQNVVFVPGWFSDRVTKNHEVFFYEFDVDNISPGTYGANNGAWSAGSAPVRADISASATEHELIDIDVVSAATDADGDTVTIAGVDRTTDAETWDNGDGTISYRPDFGFSGTDSFPVWLVDGRGNQTKVTVTVTVS